MNAAVDEMYRLFTDGDDNWQPPFDSDVPTLFIESNVNPPTFNVTKAG